MSSVSIERPSALADTTQGKGQEIHPARHRPGADHTDEVGSPPGSGLLGPLVRPGGDEGLRRGTGPSGRTTGRGAEQLLHRSEIGQAEAEPSARPGTTPDRCSAGRRGAYPTRILPASARNPGRDLPPSSRWQIAAREAVHGCPPVEGRGILGSWRLSGRRDASTEGARVRVLYRYVSGIQDSRREPVPTIPCVEGRR
jgi:hypothetical protein